MADDSNLDHRPNSNSGKLEQFVERCLQEAAKKPPHEAAKYLRANARVLEQKIGKLASWSLSSRDGEAASDVDTLGAFEITEGADRLNAAARGYERGEAPATERAAAADGEAVQ